MSIGKFMVVNGLVCLGAIYLGLEAGLHGGYLTFAVLAWFWGGLWIYGEWYLMNAQLEGMSDGELWSLESQWIGHGPFGQNKPHLSRLREGKDVQKYDRALDRMAAIYQERIRRSPQDTERVKNWSRLRDEMLAKKSRPNRVTRSTAG